MSKKYSDKVMALAIEVVGCPLGGWPETQQAIRAFQAEASYIGPDGKWVNESVVKVARAALLAGWDRPARAGEWGL